VASESLAYMCPWALAAAYRSKYQPSCCYVFCPKRIVSVRPFSNAQSDERQHIDMFCRGPQVWHGVSHSIWSVINQCRKLLFDGFFYAESVPPILSIAFGLYRFMQGTGEGANSSVFICGTLYHRSYGLEFANTLIFLPF